MEIEGTTFGTITIDGSGDARMLTSTAWFRAPAPTACGETCAR
jgi:hypothetical protein